MQRKLIYILGWGHSGSTLVDLLIGSSDNVFSLGELIFFNYYSRRVHHMKVLKPFKCTCGAEFSDCAFWSTVGGDADLARLNVVYDQSHVSRILWVLRYLFYRASGGRITPPQEIIGDDAKLLSLIGENLPESKTMLCDSSKDFARFARLLLQPDIEMVPIFLVRDVRAVAHSYTKKRRTELGLNRMTYFGAACRWAFINAMCWILIHLSGKRAVRISYDHFCDNPAETVAFLNDRLGTHLDASRIAENINATTYHNVGGNLLRFKTINGIQADKLWSKREGRVATAVAGLLFWPFNRAWVFKKHS
jgi:hypothetical protein